MKIVLAFIYNTIMHRDGLKHRLDLFTHDEREKIRKAFQGE